MNDPNDDFNDYLDRLDLDALADPHDKLNECAFFLRLASAQTDRDQFRWLISAFLSSVYSYFETTAAWAYYHITDKEGQSVADTAALAILGRYIKAWRDVKRDRVNTGPCHDLVKELYKLRNKGTHSYALSIMKVGEDLPRDFEIGYQRGQGTPALDLCERGMALIRQVQRELDAD